MWDELDEVTRNNLESVQLQKCKENYEPNRKAFLSKSSDFSKWTRTTQFTHTFTKKEGEDEKEVVVTKFVVLQSTPNELYAYVDITEDGSPEESYILHLTDTINTEMINNLVEEACQDKISLQASWSSRRVTKTQSADRTTTNDETRSFNFERPAYISEFEKTITQTIKYKNDEKDRTFKFASKNNLGSISEVDMPSKATLNSIRHCELNDSTYPYTNLECSTGAFDTDYLATP